MGYTDQTALELAFGAAAIVQLTSDEGDVVDTDVLEEVIAAADAEIDGYLATQYDLPLASVPAFVRRLSADLVWYRLHLRRPAGPSEQVTGVYDRAVKVLQRIADGKLSVGTVPAPAQNPGKAAILTSATRVFTRTSMKGF